jgi:protein ImuB
MPTSPLLKSHRATPVRALRPRLEPKRVDSAGNHPSRRLWLALYLPALPLEALCRCGNRNDPVVVIGGDSARSEVIVADDEARAAGVRAGMPFTAACALVPAIRALKRDEAEEAAALEGLALWSRQFTAFVSLEYHGLLLEIGGSLKLFGGLDTLCARIDKGVRALGYSALMGVAPTPLAAWLLARAGIDDPLLSAALLSGGLASVPVDCLDLDPQALEDLRRMGVRSFGDCCRLPRDGLARRISPQLVELLDRALGRRPDPRRSYVPPLVFERCIHPPFELRDAGALLTAAKLLLTELHGFLSARAGGVQNLEVHLGHRRVPATRLTLSLATPARDPAQLLGLLEARMSRISLVEPVVYLGVRATKILPLAPDNRDLYEPLSASGREWKTLLAQLEARLSAENVHAFSVHADYRPERAWKREGFKQKRGDDPFFNPLSPLPLWLLDRPKPLKTVAGAPCWRQPLLLHQGPQRIESGWWDRAPIARDYYVAADSANARFWIFQDLRTPRRWYLHGVLG